MSTSDPSPGHVRAHGRSRTVLLAWIALLVVATFGVYANSLDGPFVFDDEPSGFHVAAVRESLATLERDGQVVVRVKNYWPRGDSYSGINVVLRARSGTHWELQFHTPQSVATAATTRNWYEELRCVDTKLDRKRELFDKMTSEWNQVPIPKGILEPGALGAHDDIIERPRP